VKSKAEKRKEEKSMRKAILLLSAVTVVGSLLAVAPGASATSFPKGLSIGTHPVGTSANVFGAAVAGVLSKNTPMQVTVKAVAGPSTWMPMMVTKEVELGVVGPADSHPAYLGRGAYKKLSGGKGFPLRLAVTGPISSLGTIVADSCPAKTIAELKGMRVCGGYAGVPSARVAQEAALANGGLTWEDVKVVPVSDPAASVKMVMEGRADAGWAITGMPVVRELDAKKGARFLPLDISPEALARKDKIHPYSFPNLVKGGTDAAVRVDTWLMGYEFYLLCRTDLSNDVVYEINKVIWDHIGDIWAVNPRYKTVSR
jgi:TRAP transporter TAXI family solute receptor